MSQGGKTTTSIARHRKHAVYFRHDRLSPQDQRDLDEYCDMLRNYYGIPEDEPVFPKAKPQGPGAPAATSAATGSNPANHPWRKARL
jgi:hypothetical protein